MKWKKKIEVLTSVQQVICVLQYMYNVIHLCQGIFVNMYTFFVTVEPEGVNRQWVCSIYGRSSKYKM